MQFSVLGNNNYTINEQEHNTDRIFHHWKHQKQTRRITFFIRCYRKYFEKDSENLSESGSLERDIEQKKVILLKKGADVNKRNSSSGTLEN